MFQPETDVVVLNQFPAVGLLQSLVDSVAEALLLLEKTQSRVFHQVLGIRSGVSSHE